MIVVVTISRIGLTLQRRTVMGVRALTEYAVRSASSVNAPRRGQNSYLNRRTAASVRIGRSSAAPRDEYESKC